MTSPRQAVTTLQHGDADAGVIARFRDVALAIPEEPALADPSGEVSFAQVAREAAGVRRRIEQLLGSLTPESLAAETGARDAQERPVPVAVLQGHTTRAVSTILGVIGSGHPVVVLDARTPAGRLSELVERTGARLCFWGDGLGEVAANLGADCRPVAITEVPQTEQRELWTDLFDPSWPAALAFTSGSTGVPKIVINDQRMLVADAWGNSIATGCYDQFDVVAHTLPMAFHAGLMVTVAGLVVGNLMRLCDTRERGIAGLAQWIEEQECTVMHTSPAILRAFVASGPQASQLRRLRSLTVAGEAAHGRDIEAARRLLPAQCVLRNRYGSSETGLIAEYAVTAEHPPLSGSLPVGRPVGVRTVELLDPARTAAEVDGSDLPSLPPAAGVVVIDNDYLASGYWGNEAATEVAFTRNADGTVRFVSRDVGAFDESGDLRLMGRRDHSVKVRGYLVEPGDVDAALFTLPEVREAITVGLPKAGTGGSRLVSYVCSTAERPSAAAVRSELRTRLPGHLVPEAVVFLETLPRTERGKLDRAALPAPPEVAVGEPPINEWERLVAGLWCEVLGVETVGRDSDFFELGGDSLAAEELSSRVGSDLGVCADDSRSSLLAEAPTLAEYAHCLHRTPDRTNQTVSVLRAGGDKPPLFFIAGGGGLGVGFMPVVRHLEADQPVHALQSYALECRGIPDWSVAAAARRHLRYLRRVQPHGPYYIAGHSFGGIVALELAKQLQSAGEVVASLIELDSFPPDPALQPKPKQRSLPRRVRDVAGLLVTGIVPTPGLGQYWRFHEQSRVLSSWYRTPPYSGRTLVLLANSEEKHERAQWAPHLSGSWRLVENAGDHMTMLRDPFAKAVADEITAELAAARIEAEANAVSGPAREPVTAQAPAQALT